MIKIFFLTLIVAIEAMALNLPPTAKENQYLTLRNESINGGFESDKSSWTASAGSFTIITSGQGTGARAGEFDASASSQTLSNNSITIPQGYYARNGVAYCSFKTTATDYLLQTYDGTSIVSQTTIPSSSTYQRTSTNFIWPSSGSLRLRIVSQSNAAAVDIDDCYIGLADNVYDVTQASLVGSAYYTGVANCFWEKTGTSFGDFTADTDCTAPTVETNPGPGTISTTDADLPQWTVTNLPAGRYVIQATVTGEASVGAYMGLRISDGTSTSGDAAFYNDGSNVEAITLVGTFTYTTTQPSITFKLQGKASTGTLRIVQAADFGATPRIMITKYPSITETLARPETVSWKVDAGISGASPSLGTTTVGSYTEVTDSSLTLTQNTGSIATQIPCSTTNPPTGTTCAAGNESVGVSFVVPRAGDVRACVAFTSQKDIASTPTIENDFELVETPTNAQTISQTGKSEVFERKNVAGLFYDSVHLCGTFNFTSAGQKVIRLFYKQFVSGTINSSSIAGSDSKDIHWEVYPIDQQIPMPTIVNAVSNSSNGFTRIETATINCDASSAITSQQGSWISSIGNRSTGCALTIASGVFSAAPRCFGKPVIATSSGVNIGGDSSSTSTSVTIYGRNAADSAYQDFDAEIFCIGPH